MGSWIFPCTQIISKPRIRQSFVGQLTYLWAASCSRLRRILWRIVDGLLVTFGYSYKNPCLFCLPFGALAQGAG